MEKIKRRKPNVALFLSWATLGLGQIYNGHLKRGIILFLGFYLFWTILLFTGLFFKFYGMILCLAILIIYQIFVWRDAFNGALELKETTLKPYNKWYSYLIILIIGSIITSFFIFWMKDNYVRAYKIPSSSMEPTLMVGDHLGADMGIFKKENPKRGDIIIFEYPEIPSKDFIGRVISLEEEKIEIIKNKIYINDKLFDDPWGYYGDSGSVKGVPGLEYYGPAVVPRDSLFVLGDNRNNSQDSRFRGFVNMKKVKGKVLYLYWAKNKTRIGREIK